MSLIKSNITNRRVIPQGEDYFPTPAWATQVFLAQEKFEGDIWEPACGEGHISRELIRAGYTVISSDIVDRDYGEVQDFFEGWPYAVTIPPNIVTNPPYGKLADKFVAQAIRLATKKVALLLKLSYLEGIERGQALFMKTPPARIYVFSERITFYPNGVATAGAGTQAYAWFVWEISFRGDTVIKWLPVGWRPRI